MALIPCSAYRWLLRFAARGLQDAALDGETSQPDGLFVAKRKEGFVYVDSLRVMDRLNTKAKLSMDIEAFYNLSKKVVREKRTMLHLQRLYVIWQAVFNTHRLKLPMVEVGAYRGGSAYFIAAAMLHFSRVNLPFHVFDTFEGHPKSVLDPEKDPHHKEGMFSTTSYKDVAKFLSKFKTIQLHKGEFYENIGKLPEGRLGLCHVDVDTYLTTRRCLQALLPRLAPGGILVLDDFGAEKCEGVTTAVNEKIEELNGFDLWQMQTEQLVIVKRASFVD
jgi:hypothetical protein